MKILGIETSCDETAAAVVEDLPRLASGKAGGLKIISNVVATSLAMHAKTGGIIPENAARQQVKSIVPVIEEALATSTQSPVPDVDAIAVTIGPGLIGSLLVGVETAKTLSYIWNKPIIPVNHLVAHIYANWLSDKEPKFPALALVVSGGHTDLVLMKGHNKLEYLGGTRDDAAGEAFDKTARLLGLPYPGGPSISAEAEKALDDSSLSTKLNLFPRPLINEDGFDWSFSGLKTAVAREVKSSPNSLKLRRAEFAAQIQEAIVEVLVDKTLNAVEKYKPKSLLLAGGVAANKRLKEKMELAVKELSVPSVKLFIPEPKLCTDNAAVIASSAFFNNHVIPWEKVDANPELTISD